jgi:hypothetical protein
MTNATKTVTIITDNVTTDYALADLDGFTSAERITASYAADLRRGGTPFTTGRGGGPFLVSLFAEVR